MSERSRRRKRLAVGSGLTALFVAAAGVTGFALFHKPETPPPGIDVARADAANTAAAQAQADRDRAVLEAATVPLNFPAGGAPLRVLYSGDSVVAGFYSSTEATSFRSLVTSSLRDSGPVEEVHTYKPGATTTYITDNFKVPNNIDLAIVGIGTNWSREDGDSAAFGGRYGAYLESIKAVNPNTQILCLGIWARTNAQTAPIIEQISSQCEAHGGRFVDLAPIYLAASVLIGPADVQTWAGVSDTSHPNDYGHRAIADEVLKRIRR